MSIRRGLPETAHTRHDSHYVDRLVSPEPKTLGREIPVSDIRVNADQPRSAIGDLSGLKQSIKSKGIIEPLVVRKQGDIYQIISGERRFRSALELGMEKVPCVIRDSDDEDTLEVALVENLQRKDLTPFEEADGLFQLVEKYGHTHDEIAAIVGKSRSSVSETIALATIPADIRNLCSGHGITAKSMLLQIARQETTSDMLSLTDQIISRGITRSEARSKRPASATKVQKPHVFRYKPSTGDYLVTVKFKKSDVSNDEIETALRNALNQLPD